LYRGEYPFKGRNLKELYHRILNKPIEDEDLPHFIRKMLEKDKEKRITIY
jgi:hypothetical protein